MKTNLLLGAFLLFLLIFNLMMRNRISSLEITVQEIAGAVGNEFELADPMSAMQRFVDKLYFAGMAGNWPLAAFYLHELEEKAVEILHHDLTEDGVALNPLITSMFLPPFQNLEKAVGSGDGELFQARYEQLIEGCNACHQATGHGFIRMSIPERSMFQNQQFSPEPGL